MRIDLDAVALSPLMRGRLLLRRVHERLGPARRWLEFGGFVTRGATS